MLCSTQLGDFTRAVVLRPRQRRAIATVHFHPSRREMHFKTVMTIYSNLSVFHVPLTVYNGRLKVGWRAAEHELVTGSASAAARGRRVDRCACWRAARARAVHS